MPPSASRTDDAMADGGAEPGVAAGHQARSCGAGSTAPNGSANRLTGTTWTAVRPSERKPYSATRSPSSWSAWVSAAAAASWWSWTEPPGAARLAGRSRDVEQDEDRQVAPAPHAVDVDVLVRRRPRRQLDPRFDGGVDVDVVTLGLAVAALEVETQAGDGPAQRRRLGPRDQLGRGDGRLDLGDRAPVGPVAAGEDVPLGIGHLAACEGFEILGQLGPRARHRRAPGHPARRASSDASPPPRPGSPCPSTGSCRAARSSSRPTAPLPPTGLNRSNPPSVSVSSPSSSSCSISLPVWRGTCAAASSSGAFAGPARTSAGVDGAEERRRVLDRLLAPGDGEGVGRRRRSIAPPMDRSGTGPPAGGVRRGRAGPGGPRRRGTAG